MTQNSDSQPTGQPGALPTRLIKESNVTQQGGRQDVPGQVPPTVTNQPQSGQQDGAPQSEQQRTPQQPTTTQTISQQAAQQQSNEPEPITSRQAPHSPPPPPSKRRLTIVVFIVTMLALSASGILWWKGFSLPVIAFPLVLLFIGSIITGYTSKSFEWIGLRGSKKISTTTEIASPPQRTSKTEEDQPGKTLWDWLQLIIIPLVLIGITIGFNNAQSSKDRDLAADQQQENVLITYEKDISDLLSMQHLGMSKEGDAVRAVARARTLAAVHELDPRRKGLLIQFLYGAQLIHIRHPIVDLSNADLNGALLAGANLTEAHLAGANLTGANLTGAILIRASLWGADLSGADLSGADLGRADLSGAILKDAKLDMAKQCRAPAVRELFKGDCRTTVTLEQLNQAKNRPTDLQIISPPSIGTSGLEDEDSEWLILDEKNATANVSKVTDPSIDGDALEISLLSGQRYTPIQAYRNKALDKTVGKFKLSLFFYIPELAAIQAIEFRINQWVNNQHFVWGLQWQQIGDRTAQQGTPPNWRLFTGAKARMEKDAETDWQDIGKPQLLAEGRWYELDLEGDIVQGQVHYLNFSCGTLGAVPVSEDLSKEINQTFAPVNDQGDKPTVAIALDGNGHEDPYDVYIDQVNLIPE